MIQTREELILFKNPAVKGIVKALYDQNYTGYVRPDHGRHLWGERCRPGYGLYDRALGIMYLNGLWDAFKETSGGKQ